MKTDTNTVVTHMFELGRVIRRAVFERAPAAMPLVHLETLKFIRECHGVTMSEIARYLHVTPPSATDMIEKLVHEKYLSRQVDPSDRRIVRIVISKKGTLALERTLKHRFTAMRNVIRRLSPKEQADFVRILSKITNHNNTRKS